MSRRKQARPLPSRLVDDDEDDDGELKTGGVNNKDTDHINQDEQDEQDEQDDCVNDKEDANNNESKEKESEDEDEEEMLKRETAKTLAIQNMLANLQWPSPSPNTNLTLEALQNTKVAVAQLAANALANNNGENAQDLAVLQNTLFTLQQQQLLQLQLIQQLQQQLHVSNSNSDEDELSSSSPPPPPASGGPQDKPENADENKKPRSKENNVITEDEIIDEEEEEERTTTTTTTTQGTNNTTTNNSFRHNNNSNVDGGNTSSIGGLNPAFATLLNCPNSQDPNLPLNPFSPGLQSHQINNNHLCSETDVPNTLDLLTKRAQEVLDSASQGLLASSLAADDPRKKLGPYEKGREPFFKHRCRYCGKVFGSDSALQIHIRSHTGERPFKCNVCGSRFTTKGNLKVHFQRHTAKFPHVKMNAHPIPEHLDHFHPPLLQNSSSSNPTTPEHSPNPHQQQQQGPQIPQQLPQPIPFMHHSPFFGPLFRFDVKPPTLPFFNNNNANKDAPLSPQDLTKPKNCLKKEEQEDREEDDGPEDTCPKLVQEEDEPQEEAEPEEREDKCDDKNSLKGDDQDDEDDQQPENDDDEEQPENLSSKSLPLMYPLPLVARPNRPSRPSSSSASTPTTTNMSRLVVHAHLPPHQQHHQEHQNNMMFDITKDPAIYSALLPRPGSNDNAWESLIEVTKTSETSKLQQLVDNIEHKLTDPNQCIICQRVLSCKSALQMHYRTHTGERPFKCRICSRAFTTKGNLKTHMGVHRAKPPLRVLHQCPVCHKRFTNSLVLQQHIRLHTGEPTDLTPDQIRAAEVRDYPPYGNPLFGTFSTMSEEEMMMNDDTTCSETNESIDSDMKPTTSLAALENQVRTITTTAASNFAANLSSPKISSNNHNNHDKDQSSSASSAGGSPPPPSSLQPISAALDLTASRNNPPTTPNTAAAVSIFNPFHHLPTPPLNSFATSLLTPTTTSAVAALANLSSFSPVILPPPRLSESESFLWTAAAQQARGNTTCHICLKTFACNSGKALEIHYRSHTKERPFQCPQCTRSFSTKGNMKQHTLTHKIRDHHGTSNSSFDSQSHFESGGKQNGLAQSDDSNKSSPNSPKSQNNGNSSDRMMSKRPASPASPPQPNKKVHESLPSSSSPPANREVKHVCKVCRKNFSSSSALFIHMRTHTGDRPFVCEICAKAFTTRGNLKVHMQTHVFHGVSRRGRRMSLDPMTVFLPHPHHPHHLQMLGTTTTTTTPPTIKSSEEQLLHHHHRPTELFFPFNSNINAQQTTFQLNGSLKSEKTFSEHEEEDEEEEENGCQDEDAESSKENGNDDDDKDDEIAEEKKKKLCIKQEQEA